MFHKVCHGHIQIAKKMAFANNKGYRLTSFATHEKGK